MDLGVPCGGRVRLVPERGGVLLAEPARRLDARLEDWDNVAREVALLHRDDEQRVGVVLLLLLEALDLEGVDIGLAQFAAAYLYIYII